MRERERERDSVMKRVSCLKRVFAAESSFPRSSKHCLSHTCYQLPRVFSASLRLCLSLSLYLRFSVSISVSLLLSPPSFSLDLSLPSLSSTFSFHWRYWYRKNQRITFKMYTQGLKGTRLITKLIHLSQIFQFPVWNFRTFNIPQFWQTWLGMSHPAFSL